MLAAYYWSKYRPGTLHRVRPDKQRPVPPEGQHRAQCGQILWSIGTKLNPRSKHEDFIACRRCFPDGNVTWGK